MKIAVFAKSTTLHGIYGGLETQNKVLCEGLASRGHLVTIFAPKRELEIDNLAENGVSYKFVRCKFKMGSFFGFFGSEDKNNWINRSFEDFSLEHSKEKFDLILSQSSSGIGIIKRKDQLNLKIVSVSHGTIINEYKTALNELGTFTDFVRLVPKTGYTLVNFFGRQREFIHGSDRVVAVSSFVKRSLIDETFIDEDKVIVINNGIKPPALKETYKKDGSVKIVYNGRLEKSKGIDVLLSAVKQLESNKIKLVVIGAGPYLPHARKIVEDLELKDLVEFKGKVSYETVFEVLSQADIFVLPSKRFEGFPMTVIEAMFAGLPVIVSDIGGAAEAVVDKQTGFLVKSGSVYGLKEKLEELIRDEKLRDFMRQNASERAKKLYTADVMIDKYTNLFNEVLNENITNHL